MVLINNKREFAVLGSKIQESEKIDKYLDLVRELKKFRNMKVKMIPIVVVTLQTVPKSLEKRLEALEISGRGETVPTKAFLIQARGVMVIVVGYGHDDTSSILDQANCISHSTNTLAKGMNPIIIPPAMGK